MRELNIIHQQLQNQCPFIHKKRLQSLIDSTQALLNGDRLTLTQLGRSMTGKTSAKHAIKRVDRLLGNAQLYRERIAIYRWHAQLTCSLNPFPFVLIDWADVREQLRMMTLRASIAVNGRSVVLYERTFEFKHYNSPRSHQRFLDELKQVMPPSCTPILITDAGYRNTWFRQVEALGWYWLGRLRGEVGVKLAKQGWLSNKSFFTKANTQPQHLGPTVIAKKSPLACQLYLYKGADKKRKGKRHRRTGQKHSAQHLYQRSAKEPWMLATNLPPAMFTAKQVVKLYAKRMQIEESFRDLKSPAYGFGLRHCRSRSTKRLDILLLISLLAEVVLWCIGLIARQQKWQYQFQANTIKTRHVLSITRLAKEVLRRRDQRRSSADIQWAICEYIRVIHQTAMLKL